MSEAVVRLVAVVCFALVLTGCDYGLVFNNKPEMTPDEMLGRASLVFVGVIEGHHFDNYPFFTQPTADGPLWRILRRRVRVEMVLRGTESRKLVDVFEIFWTGGATGNWNATQDGDRYLFMVRTEGGKYHVVRDWWRSIYELHSGWHDRLPLTDAAPFWERFALLEYWLNPGWTPGVLRARDPTGALSQWRLAKLMRGYLRHPDRRIRVGACGDLARRWNGQDECWDGLTDGERTLLSGKPEELFAINRRRERNIADRWPQFLWAARQGRAGAMDELRLYTTVRDPKLRAWACTQFDREFPGDRDNGCPATHPPPATIVTELGDIPLKGAWPAVLQ